MKRLSGFSYPEPHDVVLVFKPIKPKHRLRRPVDRMISVIVDGVPLCLPFDSTVSVETGPDHVGHLVTIQIVASTLDSGRIT